MKSEKHLPLIRQFLAVRREQLERRYVHPSYELEQELLTHIRMGDREQATAVMSRIHALQGATLSIFPLRSKKNALIASCTLFTRAVIQGGVHPETAFQFSDTCILQIERFQELQALIRFEQEMLLQFIDLLGQERNEWPYSLLVRKAIHHVGEQLFEAFDLQGLAAQLHVSPSYLSDRFRKETGRTLNAYVNQRKVEDSTYFLLHTELTVAEIAGLFGYCNQSYYTALFRRQTGMTPLAYRRKSPKP